MKSTLSVQGLCYTYQGGTRALDGVSFEIAAGERVAVLGSNGSGKSTLFLCLNGVLRPQEGEICLDGAPIRYDKKGLQEIRRAVGIVFQDPETQLFCVDVFQEVAFGPYNMGVRPPALGALVEENLARLDLTPLRDRPPHFLSHGQKKRVSIASVLAMKPRILLFDEPTAALDPAHTRQMLDLLETFRAAGVTVLMSTHDVDAALTWCDRVIVMGDGKIRGDGTPEKIFRDHALLTAHDLCPPTVLRLFDALVARGILPASLALPRTAEELEGYITKEAGEAEEAGGCGVKIDGFFEKKPAKKL